MVRYMQMGRSRSSSAMQRDPALLAAGSFLQLTHPRLTNDVIHHQLPAVAFPRLQTTHQRHHPYLVSNYQIFAMLLYHQQLVNLAFLTFDRLDHDTLARVEIICMSQGLLKRVLSNLHPQVHLVYDQLRLDISGHLIRPRSVCGSFDASFAFVFRGSQSDILRTCSLHIGTFPFWAHLEDA